MKTVHTFEEATNAFLTYSPPSLKRSYTLERMQQLMDYLGNPQESLRVIHIAGTSGKTSTAYFIRNLLEAAGERTGLTVSPHIVAINERVQVGGNPLEEQLFLAYVNRFFELIAKADLKPTYFELLIALAYWVFAQEKVDYAVVETGLGGLLDGTNVISRPDKLCVITDIGFDHTEILGETLPEIAAQKAGIIQPYNRVVMHEQPPEVMGVVRQAVKEKRASLTIATDAPSWIDLPAFQQRNWALAVSAYRLLMMSDGLPNLSVARYIESAQGMPPGRWERWQYKGKTIILDGAHNPQKLRALRDSLEISGIDNAAVLANFADAPTKKITAALRVLQPIARRLIIPEFKVSQDIKGRRSVSAEALANRALGLGFTNIDVRPDLQDAFELLVSSPEKVLLITGSLYLVSLLRPYVVAATRPAT